MSATILQKFKSGKMKMQTYLDILNDYRKQNHRASAPTICSQYSSWPEAVILHIASQEFKRITKKNHWKQHSSEFISKCYSSYLESQHENKSGFLLEMADMYNMAPALLAKVILEEHCLHLNKDKSKSKSSNKLVNSWLKDTTLISDPVLALEVHLCVISDACYGPYTDAARRAIGFEYEGKLVKELNDLNLSFIDEVDLRNKGYDKTPDIKLEVPIAISGHIVNWIESKASFGDPITHKEYLKEQYWSYTNRFGPGMVIYWFGFVDELDIHKDQGILIFDHMPKNITYMNPLSHLNMCTKSKYCK